MKMFKNVIYLILATIIISSCGSSESSSDFDLSLIPFQEKEGGRWGFIDLEGNVKIETDFKKKPSIFKEGFALIRVERKNKTYYDFINTEGKEQDQKFVKATLFNEGFACVVEENQPPAYINKEMKIVFILKDAEEAGIFSEGLAKFKNQEGEWGFVDKTGKVVIKPKYYYVESFKEGLALVVLRSEDREVTSGFIDQTGTEVIKISDKYDNLRSFSEGLAPYSDGDDNWGFIDKKGEKVINAKDYRNRVTGFYNGYASYRDEDKSWGLIDKEGEKIIRAKYNYPLIFINGLAAIEEERKIGFIDLEGNKQIAPEFDKLGFPFIANNAIVKEGKYFIFIGKDGKQINKNEVANITNDYIENIFKYSSIIDINKTLQSEFFDIDAIVNTVISSISNEEINDIKSGDNVETIKKKYELTDELLQKSYYNSSSRKITINKNTEINKNSNYNFTLEFDESTMIYRRGYIINERAHVIRAEYRVFLQGKGRGKVQEVADAFKDKFISNNLTFLENESSDYKYKFGITDDSGMTDIVSEIRLKNDEVNIKYYLKSIAEEVEAPTGY